MTDPDRRPAHEPLAPADSPPDVAPATSGSVDEARATPPGTADATVDDDQTGAVEDVDETGVDETETGVDETETGADQTGIVADTDVTGTVSDDGETGSAGSTHPVAGTEPVDVIATPQGDAAPAAAEQPEQPEQPEEPDRSAADEPAPADDVDGPPASRRSTTPVHRDADRPAAAWSRVRRVLAPRATRAQLMAALLCALVGFALVVQVQQNRTDGLSGLRQDELVRILDEVTQRSDELEVEAARLRQTRSELVTGSDTQRAAHEAALRRAEVQGILAGALPATGPGIELRIGQGDQRISARVLYNVLEELRNAGAEAVQVNDVRLTASSYFVDTTDGVEVDGVTLRAPYLWLAIGDPDTITVALNIPGGALATVRSEEGTTSVVSQDEVVVDAVRTLRPPRYATPVPAAPED